MAKWADFETHPVGTSDRIKELEAELKWWKADSAAGWDKCEEYRLKLEELKGQDND